MTTDEIKRQIIYNYIDWQNSDEEEREVLKFDAYNYTVEDHVDEINQALAPNINWELLQKQKEQLIELIAGNPMLADLDGIASLIDDIQDKAVSVFGIDENIVFKK